MKFGNSTLPPSSPSISPLEEPARPGYKITNLVVQVAFFLAIPKGSLTSRLETAQPEKSQYFTPSHGHPQLVWRIWRTFIKGNVHSHALFLSLGLCNLDHVTILIILISISSRCLACDFCFYHHVSHLLGQNIATTSPVFSPQMLVI